MSTTTFAEMPAPSEGFWLVVSDIVGQATQYQRDWPGRKAFEVQLDLADVTALRTALTDRRTAGLPL